jgi:DNA adenine methylase
MATETGRGARAIYLNLYGHSGLWRVNSRGQFNVPPQPDRFASVDLDDVAASFRRVSKLLRGDDGRPEVALDVADFSTMLSSCGEGDVVYVDPPYLPDATSQFVGYAKGGKKEALALHQTLALDVLVAAQRGARVVVSNSPAARGVFEATLDGNVGFVVETVSSRRSIGVGKGEAVRRRQDEIIVTVERSSK